MPLKCPLKCEAEYTGKDKSAKFADRPEQTLSH